MSPSASLQSRINAFEALQGNADGRSKNLNGKVQPTPLSVPRKYEPNFLDTDSTSPTADSLFAIPPIQPVPSPSRPSSPPALGRKSSLIDFSELAASPPSNTVSVNGTGSTTSSSSASVSSTKPKLPPRVSPRLPPSLPPRKPSVTSLKSTPTSDPPPLPKRHASSPVSSPRQPNSPSLLIPSYHTYPPASPRPGASPGLQSRHMPSSSTSSFHSVSLSSDGGGDTHDGLDGSYDTMSSSTAATSPTASTEHDWEHDFQSTPKLLQRPWQDQAVSSPAASPRPAGRRPAPPPPQRRPDKHKSPAPTASHHRPSPLPLNARKRYDALFNRNLSQSSHKGRASGWRGLSVDLLTNGEKPDFGEDVPKEDRLDGAIIKQIWSCSHLPRPRLREIWSECDPSGLGSLDRDAFAKGMWKIDEELSHAQQKNPSRTLPSKSISPSYSARVPPPPLRKPNFALR